MDTSSQPTLLIGKTSFISKELMQIKWECPDTLKAVYAVQYKTLQSCATNVRNKLRLLLAASGTERPFYANELVNAGTTFFHAILPADSDPAAKTIRTWYDSQRLHAQALDIRMIWNVKTDLPWGLVFPPHPSTNGRILEPDSGSTMLNDFWCVQHRLVLCKDTPGAPDITHTDETRLSRPQYQLIPDLACKFQYYDILHGLHKDDKKRLATALKRADRSTVLYFCCKYDGTQLDCSHFAIGAKDIAVFNALRPPTNVGLIFFNGSDVHVGEKGHLWRANLYKWDGFIDTEVQLASTDARMIFCKLAEQLLEGNRTLMSVNEQVRKDNLPLSLAYTIYCWPYYSLEPHEAAPDLHRRLSHFCPTP